jgi:hypothetical protein
MLGSNDKPPVLKTRKCGGIDASIALTISPIVFEMRLFVRQVGGVCESAACACEAGQGPRVASLRVTLFGGLVAQWLNG